MPRTDVVLADNERHCHKHQVQIVHAAALHYPIDATWQKLLLDELLVQRVADVAPENRSGRLFALSDQLQL